MLRLVLPTLRCFSRKLTRDELKEVLITTFLTGTDARWVEKKAQEFCERYWHKMMRPEGLRAVAAEIASGAEVTLCSASPELVLRPFTERLGIKLIGTQLEEKDGILTGKINGNNCRCGQKIARLQQVYGDLSAYHMRAWGDSRGIMNCCMPQANLTGVIFTAIRRNMKNAANSFHPAEKQKWAVSYSPSIITAAVISAFAVPS